VLKLIVGLEAACVMMDKLGTADGFLDILRMQQIPIRDNAFLA